MKAPLFTAREVLQFALRNEQEGEALYREIAARTKNPDVRKLFLLLAKEEPRHARIFKRMLSEVDGSETIRTDPDEYVGYMIAYFSSDVLFAENRTTELPASIEPADALDFGIRRELDSITYYMLARGLVPDSQAILIDAIIGEERCHFVKFSELKRKCLEKAGAGALVPGKRAPLDSRSDRKEERHS